MCHPNNTSASDTASDSESIMISPSVSATVASVVQLTPRIGELESTTATPTSAPNAPLLRNGSPSNTSPRYLSFALPSQSIKSESMLRENLVPIPQPTSNNPSTTTTPVVSENPISSSLAALTAKVTARLVAQYPPTNTQIDRVTQTQLLNEMQRFLAKALPPESITPSTPFVVMHALLLVHRILRSNRIPSQPPSSLLPVGSAYITSTQQPQQQQQQQPSSPLIRNITSTSSTLVPTSTSLMNPMRPTPPIRTTALPLSLHSPTNLLIAGFMLADSFFSDNPTRTRTWTELGQTMRSGDDGGSTTAQIKRDALECLAYEVHVGEREFALWCSTVRRWAVSSASVPAAGVGAPASSVGSSSSSAPLG
ncbi:UNVERIFIED_CONTAM: hypothetical protein HDU68_007287 [Siphonaria sp. JEL0065]|nr:hypothetical protein HDU68_007287 [Siphonaria sp. JEL0065]